MAAIGPEITRRALLFAALAFPLSADDSQDIWSLLTEEATALSDGNLEDFMAGFDHSMPGYQSLRTNVSALLDQTEVQSAIDLLSEEGSGPTRTVSLDWFLQLVEQQDEVGLTRRREVVRCKLEKRGKKWRIIWIDPISFFAPPPAR
jgi:hypothetical protein